MEAPAYLLDKADSLDDSDACFAGISRFKSDTSVLHPRERNTLRLAEPTQSQTIAPLCRLPIGETQKKVPGWTKRPQRLSL